MNTAYYDDKNTPVTRLKVLTVYYDGGCPMCAREVGMYQSLKGAEFIEWVNLSTLPDGEVAPGVIKKNALARFHAVDYEGNIYVGAAAFAALWCMLPRFRILGALFNRWPFRVILDRLYRLFLVVRPFLQVILHARSRLFKRIV